MCDVNLKIINCVVRYTGSTHDSRILTESDVYQAFMNKDIKDCVVLGDSGYPLKEWFMVPYINPMFLVTSPSCLCY